MRFAINQLAEILGQAQARIARKDFVRAEQLLRQAVAIDSSNREALEHLVVICLRSRRADAAQEFLQQLVREYPTQPMYCDRLATLLDTLGRSAEVIPYYRQLLAARPALTNSRYNLARLLKREGHLEEALKEYRECLSRKIEKPEEVLSNISVIHTDRHQHEEARQALKDALKHNPAYVPALHNLALLEEEEGDWNKASASFRRILELEPLHTAALAHIANGEKTTDSGDPLIRQLKNALGTNGLASDEREELSYALGKALDDCQQFNEAFDFYQQANKLSAERCGAYDRAAQELLVDQLISHCDSDWMKSIEPVSDAPLVFICGMFRSGTTLLEQILTAHPALTPGGELDFFQQEIKPFPSASITMDSAQLQSVGRSYVDYLQQHFPAGARVTNKRPDNFLCLALLKALFPNALVINTRRQPLDNSLSLYFQPLDSRQAYANDLADCGHYYLQQQRLLSHWQLLLDGAILEVSYESLVREPREVITATLAFLELDWHEGCLDFHAARNRVRTASVHQVRQPLYQSSSDRWQNYASQVEDLREYLATGASNQ